MLRPAGRVSLYLPKRSTMPARACGTIRTVLASRTTTKTTTSSEQDQQGCRHSVLLRVGRLGRTCGSGLEAGHRVDVGRRALDLQDLDGLAGARCSRSRRRARRSRSRRPALIRPGLRPVISSVTRPWVPTSLPWPSASSGPLCSRLTQRRADQRQHGDRRGERPAGPARRPAAPMSGGDHADEGAGGEHDQDQVEAEHLGDAEQRSTAPSQVSHEVVAEPVHAPDPIQCADVGGRRAGAGAPARARTGRRRG